MKIAVIGTTGATGALFAEQAQKIGHQIIALARRPEAITLDIPSEDKRKIDIPDEQSFVDALKGCDAVVSALGSGSLKAASAPTTVYSSSIRVIIPAMRANDIKRLFVLSSGGIDYDTKAPWFYNNLIRRYLINSYMDMMKMETILEENLDIEWTIVRPTQLLDGKSADYLVKNRIVGEGNFKIHRIDVAHFILKELEQNQWIHQYPALGYP